MRRILSKFFFLIGYYIPNIVRALNTAEDVLKRAGYKYPSLDFTLTPLLTNDLDLSIVIPVYNSEKYIRRCLDSIINQKTNYNYEIVCVNDGSTDATESILYEYTKVYGDFIHVVTQNNCGIAVARNKGIEIAKGKYIGFVDNDDYLSTDYVEKMMRTAIKSDADIIQAGIINVDDNENKLSKIEATDSLINYYDSVKDKSQISGYIWNGILKKSLFERIRFPNNFWYEDMITRFVMLRIAKKSAIIGECLYFKRIHASNASKTLWKSRNIKSVDSFWLAKCLVNYSMEKLDCIIDDYLYNELLYEFSTTLCVRTRYLGFKKHRAVFSLASQFIRGLNYNCFIENTFKHKLNKSFLEGNYLSWFFLCLSDKIYPISKE